MTPIKMESVISFAEEVGESVERFLRVAVVSFLSVLALIAFSPIVIPTAIYVGFKRWKRKE